MHAQTLLSVARRQCRRELILPAEPLCIDGSSESPVLQDEDLDPQSSSDESSQDEDELYDSSSGSSASDDV